ncbi:MAG: alpha-ketoacid dehydrogenase subunit beta [Thaumarchaeota archaeon]|nr:alpha-ketoacid dehydrogenase subunit beta [Nitrososphaerota archaeon]MCL5318530.1 alpha-ketoacid dehydrogenase subunit beta [Nitrososphaerota archaeon]
MAVIQFSQAINQALYQLLEKDTEVFLIGQGVTSPWYVGGTTVGLVDRFGAERVFDTPVSENGVTGTAVGAALAGAKPVLVFPRLDFMYYAFDQLINHAANWHYMFGGQLSVPLVIWGIVNRGGEQAAQHAQSIQAMMMHVPGLKVVMPSTPYDAKGLMISAVTDGNPVMYIDERWLYQTKGEVPEEMYKVPLGKGVVRREGGDVTVVATSYMVLEALKAAEALEKEEHIDVEVIDPRSIKPLDKPLLLSSVKKTGRFVVVDAAWQTGGVGAELSAIVASECFDYLKAPVARVSLPDAPAPSSSVLEKAYYPTSKTIIKKVKETMARK